MAKYWKRRLDVGFNFFPSLKMAIMINDDLIFDHFILSIWYGIANYLL